MFFAKNGIGRVEIVVILLVMIILGFILYPVYKQNMTYLKPYTFDRVKWEQDGQKRAVNRAKKRANVCLSNLRQLAMGAEMYVQDHHDSMPGINKINKDGTATYTGWAVNINKYLKGVTDANKQSELFTCPDTLTDLESPICYGYNSSLIKIDGTGINKNAIKKPDQVGLLCDSTPGVLFVAYGDYKVYGGGIFGGYSLAVPREEKCGRGLSVLSVPRHMGTINIAYTDGHVATRYNNYYRLNDPDNIVSRAFYQCQILGLVDNPAAGLGGNTDSPFGEFTDRKWSRTVFGGDPVTSPILVAAGEVQKKMAPGFRYKNDGFKGSLSSDLHPSDYLEGVATGKAPVIDPQRGSSIQIGIDAMVVIVNKDCAIKVPDIELDLTKKVKEKIIRPEKFWRLITMRNLQTIINSDGYGVLNSAEKKHQPANYTATCHDWQLYLQNKYDGTRSAIAMSAGNFYIPGGFGAYYRDGGTRDHKSYIPRTPGATRSSDACTYRGIYCNTDMEIINKVASDPLGIGVVSAAFVDTQKVDILAVDMNTHVRWAAIFPISDVYSRYERTETGLVWPFQRKLYVVYGKTGTASEKIFTRVLDKGKDAFFAGPLYKSSFWPIPVKETANNLKPMVGSAPKPPKQSTPQKTP